MKVNIPFGSEIRALHIDSSLSAVVVLEAKNPSSDRTWDQVVGESIRDPVGAQPICRQDLRGKKVVVITDDWGRPTPAWQVMPLILKELGSTGVADGDITFITASGMHEPMSAEALERKLGAEVVSKYRCISHDAGDRGNLAFVGVSAQGTPVWVSRYVAEVDYKIALGRIFPHEAFGYEGGYKMIMPGVSAFDTITRDHSFNFSPLSAPGVHENPSRQEADDIGRMVGIDFLINVVVNSHGQPMKSFCGEPMQVHRRGIAWGDQEVWGAEAGERADITVVSPGGGDVPEAGYCLETLYRAARITRDGGCIICLASRDLEFDEQDGKSGLDESICDLDERQFVMALSSLTISALLQLHEKPNWRLNEREVQHRIKAVRGEFYQRRRREEIRKRRVVLTPDPDSALRQVLSKAVSSRQRIAILPQAGTTLAKERLYRWQT